MSTATDTMKRLYRLIRRIPLAGLAVTGVVRLCKAIFLPAPRSFDGLADELHVVGASVQTLRADLDQLAVMVAALKAEQTGDAPRLLRDTRPIEPLATPVAAILARDETSAPQQIALDLNTTDRSTLMAQIAACAPAALSAATIPLSGCETPEAVRALAQALGNAMRDRAVLCLRLLDRLSLFLAAPRETGAGAEARQLSPQIVLEIFERQGCRLIGLRRGMAGAWPTVDLIIEMRES
ncbi:MAG: hypothetical protein KF735_14600 [Chelatococcus sp.]|jgi:hypothetical protein|uniref:hypothetical protein n=1 Tax=unclassified Chelatococcus TaxID=2638111 RepID=UPI001BCFE273|nr:MULTISPECIES: hypothetical protein [unclassified Chelatococcus]CAH1656580.1 conserved hypothetical protein [Hyphomicrobiales bacterium]MBS7740556.1 hypothetical protein [Chelatococcus sp. HY11]MBX3538873.1 hypothetical protein [Chelatococcus sp.]MBX3544660.1 hypothetical protein [Chelatococcus sp.]MCO5078201.1 hypothetical protein [Chelatococcus sp.]